ncbi:ATP-binding protein [Chloroflexota bacterium]
MSPFAALSLLAFFIAVFLAYFAYIRNPSGHINRLFCLLCIFLAYSAFAEFGYRQADTLQTAQLWYKIGSFWPIPIALLLHFILVYTKHTRLMCAWGHLAIYGPALLFSILEITTNTISSVPIREYWGWTANLSSSWVVYLLMVWIVIVLIICLVSIWAYCFRRITNIEKKSSFLIAIGLSIPIIVGLTLDGILHAIGVHLPEITSTSFVVGSVFIFIAIHEFELFYKLPIVADTIFKNTSDLMFILDKRGQITRTSTSTIKKLDFAESDIIGHKLDELIINDLAKPLAHLNIEFSGLAADNIQLEDVRCYIDINAKEPLAISLSVTPLLDEMGRMFGYIAIARDIADRVHFENQLQQAYRQESETAQKLQDQIEKQADYTRALVHELKTPLTSIILASGLLASGDAEQNSVRLVSNIRDSSKKLSKRIGELLDLAKDELGVLILERKKTDICELIHEACEAFVMMAPPTSVSFSMQLASDIPPLNIDASRIEQVIQNLLSNAFKWTPEGGNVIIDASKDGYKVLVKVQDFGPGIPADQHERIFERYYMSSQDSMKLGGMGLGLALCKVIVKNHGGDIWVESIVNKGSTFSFSLPINQRAD